MNIECDKPKTIYKYKTKDGKEFYSIGLSKKKQDGSWETGFISCRFPKETQIENKTRILIKRGWVDFYVKDRITYPFIFINQYVEVKDSIPEDTKIEEIPQNTKTEYDTEKSDIQISDEDLPF